MTLKIMKLPSKIVKSSLNGNRKGIKKKPTPVGVGDLYSGGVEYRTDL